MNRLWPIDGLREDRTWIIVVQTPCLDVVLGELGVGEQLYGVGHQLHVALREPEKLEVHPADLRVEGVEVEEVGAVELLIVGLVQGQLVLLALEHLNLQIIYSNVMGEYYNTIAMPPHLQPLGRS